MIDCTKYWRFAQYSYIFVLSGGIAMRIVLDTEKGRIILPKSFFTHLDKMNKILAEGGSDKKWTAEEYVRDQFDKVHQNEGDTPDCQAHLFGGRAGRKVKGMAKVTCCLCGNVATSFSMFRIVDG